MKRETMPELKAQAREVWRLSLPAILTQITTIAMQYIDSAMVGALGANASASIGLVSTSTWLIGGIIGGVSAGVSCAKLLSLFEEKEFITPVTADGKSYEAGSPVSTGMILRLPGGEEYTLLVKGDTNGDGSVDIFDLAQIRNQILSGEALTGAALAAADVNEDGNVDIFDYHAVRRSILDGTTL